MVYQASFTGLLKTILILVAVYYAIKFLVKIFAPLLMKYAAKKMEEKVNGHFQQHQNATRPKPKDPIHKQSTKKVGEYIDFEEID